MDNLEIAKTAATIVVGWGTNTIIKTIIKNQVQPQNIVDKVTVNSAALVLAAMVAHESKQYTSAKIDKIAGLFREAKEKTEEIQEENVETTEQ